MRLTGKAKEKFKEWYEKQPPYTPTHVPYDRFMAMSPSMQWGIYQDWADSMGYRVDVLSETVLEIGTLHGFTISKVQQKSVPYYPHTSTFYDKLDSMFGCVGYEEARDAAIAKLNEIINEQ